jgi:hypothetical protein
LISKVNSFNFTEKIKAVTDLSDGLILSKLIALIVGTNSKEKQANFKDKNKDTYYAVMDWFFKTYVFNQDSENGTVHLNDARNGDIFEIGKVSFQFFLGALLEKFYVVSTTSCIPVSARDLSTRDNQFSVPGLDLDILNTLAG